MSEEYENEFYVLLRSFREKRQEQRRWGMKWDQGAVAKRLGVSRMAYINWENGQLPTRIHLKKIVSIFYLDEVEERALYRAAAEVRPDIENLPFKPNPFFTGRKEELEQIRQKLLETGTATITQPISKSISISGLGGIGKTELALEYAHRFYPDVYSTALWVNAADEGTLQVSYVELAKTLNLPEQDERNLDRRIQAVKDWLKMHTNWLLIMDNAEDLPLAESFLPAKPLGHVIITTQSQTIDTTTTQSRHIKIEALEPNEGLLLLLLRSHMLEDKTKLDTVAVETHDVALKVVKLLGCHPLALDQAGAYIEGTGVSFNDYLERYRKERRR